MSGIEIALHDFIERARAMFASRRPRARTRTPDPIANTAAFRRFARGDDPPKPRPPSWVHRWSA